MAVTVLDCDVITPGPYSLNWGAPGIKDVYVYILIYLHMYTFIYFYIGGHRGSKMYIFISIYLYIYIFIYLGALGIKSFSSGKDIYSFPGELLSRNWYYCCIGIIIWFCHNNIKEEVALLV